MNGSAKNKYSDYEKVAFFLGYGIGKVCLAEVIEKCLEPMSITQQNSFMNGIASGLKAKADEDFKKYNQKKSNSNWNLHRY